MLPKRAEVSAAVSIIPSMAMLMTPERSHSTPLNAASAMGVARCSAVSKMPIRFRLRPRAAQVRNESVRKAATSPSMAPSQRPRPRASCSTPRSTESPAITQRLGNTGRTRSGTGSAAVWRAGLSPSRAAWPGSAVRANNTRMAAPIRINSTPMLRLRRRAEGSMTRAATVMFQSFSSQLRRAGLGWHRPPHLFAASA